MARAMCSWPTATTAASRSMWAEPLPDYSGRRAQHPTGVAVDGAGNLYIGDTRHGRILFQPAGAGTPTVLVSDYTFPMQTPTAIALDAAGNVYFVGDTGAGIIDEIPAAMARRSE